MGRRRKRGPAARRLPAGNGSGKDGLNLVEFPLSVLANKVPDGLKTLEFKETVERDGQPFIQRVTITGSDKFGLPTAQHHKFLVGLIQLTFDKNSDLGNPRVEFTRYELLKKLKLPDTGHYYKLAKDALHIWKGTNIYFKNAWWVDGKLKTKGFSILDDFELYENPKGKAGRPARSELNEDPSYIVWGSVLMDDFRKKRTKGLDYELFLDLRCPISQQLYRHLDKWFWYGPKYTHPDLRTFACEKIGISRKYDNANLMRALDKGWGELSKRGYLKRTSKKRRYAKRQDGRYSVLYELDTQRQVEESDQAAFPELGAQALVERGVSDAVARELAKDHGRGIMRTGDTEMSAVEYQIEHYDWLVSNGKAPDDSGAWLTAAIRNGWRAPASLTKRVVEESGDEEDDLDSVRRECEKLGTAVKDMFEKIPVDAFELLDKNVQDAVWRVAYLAASDHVRHAYDEAQCGKRGGKSGYRSMVLQQLYYSLRDSRSERCESAPETTEWLSKGDSLLQEYKKRDKIWKRYRDCRLQLQEAETAKSQGRAA